MISDMIRCAMTGGVERIGRIKVQLDKFNVHSRDCVESREGSDGNA